MTDRHPTILRKIGDNAWAVWPSTEAESPQARRAYRKAQESAQEIGRRFAEEIARGNGRREERSA